MNIENPFKTNESKKIEVTTPKPEDARGIHEVFYKTWLGTYPNKDFNITIDDLKNELGESLTEERITASRKQIEKPLEHKILLVAKNGNEVVGVCLASKHEDRNELEAIYILPEYQRKGVGRQLWDKVYEFFDPNKDIVVRTISYNSKAISFYRGLGFVNQTSNSSIKDVIFKNGKKIPQIEMRMKSNKLSK